MPIPAHGDATSVANLHRPGFVSATDPAAEDGMAAWKLWIEVDGSNNFVALHLRNAANSGWVTVITAADLATQAELDAAIAALKDGVSTSFDTLAEIAALLTAHHTQHENGGSDEISVAGLSGVLADPQTPASHTLGSHSDVNAPSPSDGDRLTWDAATSKWIPSSATTGYTDEEAQDAVGSILDDGGDIDFTYDDATPKITAVVKSGIGLRAAAIPFVIDGGGSAITTGVKGDLEIPFAGTITGWTVLGDQSGSITIDTWKDTYANFPPTVADTMWGTKPNLSAAAKNQATGLSIAVTAGDIIRFNVDSAATVTRVTLSFTITKS